MSTHRSIAFLAVFAAFGLVAKARPSARRAEGPARTSPTGKYASARRPFDVGEKLFYQIAYLSMNEAATAELTVEPRRDFYGDPVWHFQGVTHTEPPLRLLMAVDDQFDSYSDAATLASRQYELYLNEMGKSSVRKLSLGGASPGAQRVHAPAGTRDPLAMLYRLRLVNWQKTPRFTSSVYDGNHFYSAVASLAAAHDPVIVPAGKFDASRISLTITPHDSGTEPMQFTLWLANNPARTPVELDAQIRVGTVKGQLTQIQ